MKKRGLSLFLVLALCLTLLPAPVWAKEGDAPIVSEQAKAYEDENGAEGDQQDTGTPDAEGAESGKADAPENGGNEDAENHADAAYAGMQAAYDAYEALTAEQQTEITGANCFETLFGYFNSRITPLADAQSGEHTHCVCGKDHKDVGGHDREDATTFIAWTSTDSLPDSGVYYLADDVTIASSVSLTDHLTLCLNGHTVNVSSGATIKINGGGTLTLTDCTDKQGKLQGHGQLGIQLIGSKDNTTDTVSYATLLMYGGTITGFSNAVIVGGASSTGAASFTMYGGAITGNSTNANAAVSGRAISGATAAITMYGGEISGNTGEAGGGVYVGEKCTFTLEGGKISSNTATGRIDKDPAAGSGQQAKDGGGGVYLDHMGYFTMTGGEISDNTANGNGGGICVMAFAASPDVTITNGKITGNTANNGTGGGIYGGPAKLTIQDTEISGNECAESGGGIFANQPLTLTNAQVINNTANTAGGGVKLGGDDENFEGKSALTVSGNTSISGNTPNNYYVDWSYFLPIKVSSTLDADARIGICMNQISSTDDKFLPTTTSDSVVAEAAEGVTLNAENFIADNSDYEVRTDVSGGVKFGLCDHNVLEGSNECGKCHTQFAAVLEPKDTSAKKEYFLDLSKGADFINKNGTLKLLQDVTLSTGLIDMRNCTLTLDLNGHTISGNRNFSLHNSAALTVIDGSGADTTGRTLNVAFTVDAGCTLNLYDGTNAQGFRGTVTMVQLWRGGKLVSCGGTVSTLWLSKSDSDYGTDWDVRLWQSNAQFCTVGTIQYRVTSGTIKVSEFLKKNHPGAMLYGTKNGGTAAEKISGDTKIDCDNGVDGAGGYTNLYLQTCEEHEPTSASDLTCKNCGAELVVKITAMKDETERVGYFAEASKDKATWLSGYAEATAQLADWVNTDGCTEAKLFPLTNDTWEIPVACKMTLMGTGRSGIDVLVKDGADVLLDGGEYDDVTVIGGKATLKGEKYNYYGVTVKGGEAVFESGTCSGTFEMTGGVVTVKDDVKFASTSGEAFKVEKGTLNVEDGTISGGVKIYNPVNLTISGGTFEKAVTITRNDATDTGTCSISGGTFADKLTLSGSKYVLSALLAKGCAYYQGDTIVSGEVKELTNVTVNSGHVHTIDADTGVCSECSAKMEASVTVGEGTPAYYATRAAAVDALNAAGDGAKTLKLFQGRTYLGATLPMETYTLTSGPVTLDLNGQSLYKVTFVAQGVELTLKSEASGGSVTAVQAIGKDSKIIANSTNIADDGNVMVRTISAEKGGRLKLSAGTFLDLYVVNDGSSARLSGGLYKPSGYCYGGGPDDKDGTGGKYVGAYDLLPEGYRYKKKNGDQWSWVSTDSEKISGSNDTYTMAYAGVSFEKFYPDDKTDFTGSTYAVQAGTDGKGNLTLTALATTPTGGQASYTWEVQYAGRTDWKWAYAGARTNGETYAPSDATLTISNLPEGTYQYRVRYELKAADGNIALTGSSDPLTVVVTRHEHSWKYELKEGTTDTITAKCTAEGCYLTDGNGGSVTISAPAAVALTYDGTKKPATLTWTDWVDAGKKDAVEKNVNSIWYTGTYGDNKKWDGNIAPADAGTYTASLTMTVSDGSEVKATSGVYTISKATLTVTGTPGATAPYKRDQAVKDIPISGLTVTLNGKAVKGTWSFSATNVPEVDDTTAYTATFKPSADRHNYEPLTLDIVPTITKGIYDGAVMDTTKNVLTNQEQSGVEVSMMPNITDAAIYAVTESSDPNNIISNVRHENGKVLFDVANVEEAGKTATITVTYSSKNYENFTGTIKVETVKKDPAYVSITGLPQTVTYGQEFTLTATQTGDTSSAGNPWSWDFDETYFKRISGGIDQGKFTLTLQAIKAGTPDKGITVTYESSTHKGSATVAPVVEKKEVTVAPGSYKVSKTYDGTTNADIASGALSVIGILPADSSVTVQATPVAYTNANVGGQSNMNVNIALAGTGSENYKIKDDATSVSVPCEITAKTITISGAAAANRDYVQNDKSVVINGVTFTGAIGTLTKDTDYTVTGKMDDANAGANKIVNVTVTLTGSAATNYTLTSNTTTTAVTVNQIDPTAPTGLTGVKGQALSTVTLPTGWAWDNPSTTMSTTGSVSFTASYAGSTNYKAKSNIDVTVTVSDKELVTISGLTAAAGLTYNGSVQTGYTGTPSYSPAWSGTPVVTYYLNDGTTKTTAANSGASGEGLAPKNAGDYKVTFAIPDSDPSHTGHVTLAFSIAKRTISVKADNKSMTVNGTLPTFTVSYGNFASGDSEANVIETKANASCAAAGTSTGSFPITVGGTTVLKSGMDTNYQVGTPENGTLTVNPAYSGEGGGSVTTYSVTVGKSENGTVSVSPKSAAKGSTVTITVAPDKGYVLETLTALDKDGKELKLTEKDGKYTFTMPAGKVEVKATFMDDNTMLNYFVDVQSNNYYYDAVLWAAQKGITSGTDATHFSPNAACTRAQIVTFLWRAAGSPEPKGTGSFADVPAGSYYAKAVAWAVENGITGGTGDGQFSPDATCTREQAVTFLYRAFGSPTVSGGSAFGDVAENAYYADAVAWAEKNEITGGIGGGLFGSGNDCTRAQIVTFLYRAYQGK